MSDRFAPITSSIGFLQFGTEDAAHALSEWRQKLVPSVIVEKTTAGFPECLRTLEPLTGGARPRELLVEASDGWTAYFDCSLRGTDAISAIGYLSRACACQGLAITTVPHTVGLPGVANGQMGSIQFEMFGPLQTDFLNYVRTVALSFDGGRWVFETSGTEQWFENAAAYGTKRVRERFTTEILENYCRALGLEIFDPGSYGPTAFLIRSQVPVPVDGYVMTLEETQRWLEITPGQVDGLAG